MAAKKSNPAMDFIVQSLQKDRGAQYRDIKEAADKKKLKIFPIMFGRAQALLGIVKSSPRGQGRAARAKASKASAASGGGMLMPRRGPGRPRKNPISVDGSSLEGIIAAVKGAEQERNRYRTALERIHGIVAEMMQ